MQAIQTGRCHADGGRLKNGRVRLKLVRSPSGCIRGRPTPAQSPRHIEGFNSHTRSERAADATLRCSKTS
eukprot:scaffold25224_cov33-Tisochrysis_lutea.AAC.1